MIEYALIYYLFNFKIKAYSVNINDNIPKIYGISQNPNTKDHIIIQDIYCNGNKQIDNFIQEMQLKRSSHNDIVFEWIPYNQLDSIEEIGKGGFATVYSAIWKVGPLYYDDNKEYTRDSDKTVALKLLHNSQDMSNKFLDEV